MKITIKKDSSVEETEITVTCRTMSPELEEIVAYIGLFDNTITGMKNGETFFIPMSEVLYFEYVDGRVFFYTSEDIYETAAKLYRIEEKLTSSPFVRVSKTVIVNLKKIRSIRPEKNSRLCATLVNGERIMVSRQYLGTIKKKLGVK